MDNNIESTLVSLLALTEIMDAKGSLQTGSTSSGSGSSDSINMNALENGLLLNLAEHALENLGNSQQNSAQSALKQELKVLNLLAQMNSLNDTDDDDDDDDDDTSTNSLFGNQSSNSTDGLSNSLEQAFLLGLAAGSKTSGSSSSSSNPEADLFMALMGNQGNSQSQVQSTIPNNSTNAQNGFNISSWGDPHITSSINGQQSVSQKQQTDNPNLLTVGNTTGGSTTISTTETAVDSNGVDYNHTVDINGGGSNSWDVHAVDNNGTMAVTYAGNNGTQTLQDGQTIQGSDGTTIALQNGKLTVNQSTTNGGSIASTISDNGQGGLDVGSIGSGQSYISGSGVDLFNTLQKTTSGTTLTA